MLSCIFSFFLVVSSFFLHMFDVIFGCVIVVLHMFNAFIGYVVVVLHFSNVSIGCPIVFLHRSSVFIDFRKGREDFFKTND